MIITVYCNILKEQSIVEQLTYLRTRIWSEKDARALEDRSFILDSLSILSEVKFRNLEVKLWRYVSRSHENILQRNIEEW